MQFNIYTPKHMDAHVNLSIYLSLQLPPAIFSARAEFSAGQNVLPEAFFLPEGFWPRLLGMMCCDII